MKELGMTQAEFARKLKVDSRTVRNALTDRYAVNPGMLKRARTLHARHAAEALKNEVTLERQEPPPSEEALPQQELALPPAPSKPKPGAIADARTTPEYATPAALFRMRTALKWTQREMAEHIDCATTYFHSFEKGRQKVGKSYYPPLEALSAYVDKGDFSHPPPKVARASVGNTGKHWKEKRGEGASKSSTGKTGAGKILALNTSFQERFRQDRNRRLHTETITFIGEQFSLEPKVVRDLVGTYLTILKDNMQIEEMVDLLIGS